ncbi:MAG TPA: VOC family protein [Solirubrobacterales bacterium]|jgi:catechol 2,3-dioxygenase-like lactoylglutathione lyase family enzyme|nr:VOC family protein [Solirubrobacterales bacterium]
MSLSDSRVGATIAVSDLGRAREFYEGTLGLSPGPMNEEGGVVYVCGEGTSLLVYLSPDHAGKATATLATWEVDDLEATVDELTAKGVTFERYEEPETDEKGIHAIADNRKVAWFKDPEGNVIAVGQFG